MDFSSSLRKSFNKSSHGSSSYKQKHTRKISAGVGNHEDISHQEEQPILSHQHNHNQQIEMNTRNSNDDCHEVIVKIDPSNTWPDYSYEFWKANNGSGGGSGSGGSFQFPRTIDKEAAEDPPTKLIGQFINKQRASGTEMPFDVVFDDDHNKNNINFDIKNAPQENHIPISQSKNTDHHRKIIPSKDIKVSFQSPASDNSDHETSEEEDEIREMHSTNNSTQFQNPKRSSSLYPAAGDNTRGGGEVLKCTSFQRPQSILRTKTRSRLIDPPEPECRTSGKVNNNKSGQVKSSRMAPNNRVSGMLREPEEEDDPLIDDDVPDEFLKGNVSALTILQWVSLVLIVAALICTLAIRKWKIWQFKGLRLWKWEVLILVLICGRLVSGWGIRFVVFFIERNFLLRKRVLYFVYGVRKAVQNCIWLGLVLLAWHFLFDKRIEKETNGRNRQFLKYVNKLLLCFLVGSLLWLVKTLMVKVLASSFHVSTFFDRIQESLFNQYVIETLSGPPVIEMQNVQEDEDRTMADIRQLQSMGINVSPELRATAFTNAAKSGGLQRPPAKTLSKKFSRVGSSRNGSVNNNSKDKQEQGIPIEHLHRWNPKNISAWNMKRLMRIVRHGVLSTLDEQIQESSNGDESSNQQIRSEIEAKAAARKIFQSVARRGSKYIYVLDLMRFMREDEAVKTMALLGGSAEREKISKYALKSWVVNAFRERKALALTLNDTKTAVNKLHQMVNILVAIIILVVCLLILGFATSKFLLFISSQVVVVAFVFGNTCKTVFEAIIFLFVMHPFDVGDRCEIDGVQMIVEEMNILSTIFLRVDNQKIFYPNSTLSTKCIGNYYRSPDMGDSVDFHIHITTPAEKIAMLRQRIISYLESKKDYWYSSPSVVLMNLEDLHMVKLSVWMRHRMNHQDMGEKWMRRALLVEEMIKIFKEIDMNYRLHPRDINVRSMPTLTTTRIPDTWVALQK